jgi:uncharacterized protein YcfJ
MDKSMIKGMAVGGIATAMLGAGAVTGYQTLAQPKVAEVVAVRPVMQGVTTPQVRCENVQVRRQAPVQDPNRIAGTVIGGVAGGLLGSTIGGGNGKKVATVAGAVAGGYAGNRVQKNLQDNDVVSTTEQRCKTVQQTTQRLVGYDVTYRLNGEEGRARTSFEPGPTLPVKDGRVVVTPPAVELRS